jgi:hypothetical protein
MNRRAIIILLAVPLKPYIAQNYYSGLMLDTLHSFDDEEGKARDKTKSLCGAKP